jgi:hypothetical protein
MRVLLSTTKTQGGRKRDRERREEGGGKKGDFLLPLFPLLFLLVFISFGETLRVS